MLVPPRLSRIPSIRKSPKVSATNSSDAFRKRVQQKAGADVLVFFVFCFNCPFFSFSFFLFLQHFSLTSVILRLSFRAHTAADIPKQALLLSLSHLLLLYLLLHLILHLLLHLLLHHHLHLREMLLRHLHTHPFLHALLPLVLLVQLLLLLLLLFTTLPLLLFLLLLLPLVFPPTTLFLRSRSTWL